MVKDDSHRKLSCKCEKVIGQHFYKPCFASGNPVYDHPCTDKINHQMGDGRPCQPSVSLHWHSLLSLSIRVSHIQICCILFSNILPAVILSYKRLLHFHFCQDAIFLRMPICIAVHFAFTVIPQLFQVKLCNINPLAAVRFQNTRIP